MDEGGDHVSKADGVKRRGQGQQPCSTEGTRWGQTDRQTHSRSVRYMIFYVAAKATYIRLLHGKIGFLGFFRP